MLYKNVKNVHIKATTKTYSNNHIFHQLLLFFLI